MGTTADKLQAVLNSKNAIRDKFNLGDIPFSQYAENINAGGDSPAGTEFYKCVDITPDAREQFIMLQQPQYHAYLANGQIPKYLYCQFYLMDKTSSGTDRIWRGIEVGWSIIDGNPESVIKGYTNWYIGYLTAESTGYNGVKNAWYVYDILDGELFTMTGITTAADPWGRNDGDNSLVVDGGLVTAILGDEPGMNAVIFVGGDEMMNKQNFIFRRSENWTNGEYYLEFNEADDSVIFHYGHGGSPLIFSGIPAKKHIEDSSIPSYPVAHLFYYPTTAEKELTSGYWVGNPITLNDDKYIVDDSVSQQFRYDADNGLQPARGGIYDSDLKISVDTMYKNLTGTGGLFLCTYVNRNYFSYNTIVVSGMPTAPFVGSTYVDENTWETADVPADVASRDPNGAYTLQNPDDEIYNWYWLSSNGCVIDHWDMGSGQPVIYPDKEYKNTSKFLYVQSVEGEIPQYPVPDDYSSFEWKYSSGSSDTVVSGGLVVVPKPLEVEKYWEGYKLEADENGKYNLASNKTKLTYGDYMPVTGRIYDAACTVEVTNADFTEDALWSCPRNMTSNENDEWKVSIIDNKVYNNQEPYYAFDGSNFDEWEPTAFKGDNANNQWFLQWQNKQRPVLLKVLYGMPGGGDWGWHWDNYDWQVLGSNNGEDWDILFKGRWKEDGNWGTTSSGYFVPKRKILIEGSFGPYSYYRLGVVSANESWQAHHIEAFSQIPREVPK